MNQRVFTIVTIIVFASSVLTSQYYDDYIGAGHDRGVTVRSSSNAGTSLAANTINGIGLDANKMAASRFLFQASFGADMDEIETLAETLDYEGWIDNQFNQPLSLLLPKLWETDARARAIFEAENDDEYFGPFSLHFQYTWWDNNYKAPDQLRHRIAYALSQILVISINSQLGDYGEGLASYYDILVRNALGNYEDALQEISVDPNMGFYLSHFQNPKTDQEAGTRPDENYAREIMQLFTVGLYELNNDGTRKVDGNGSFIPTYDNTDIQELAKVFTGLKGGAWSRDALQYVNPTSPVDFNAGIHNVSREVPMQMDETKHEPGPKTIIGDYTIPDGQTGMEDIQQAVRHLFNHPNVGPFIAHRLIQQLIKSNPSPAYIDRVARAFNDNGSGIRGDMKAVVKAILLDQEARDCAENDPASGKLKEPIMRYTHFLHAIPGDVPDGYYWNNGFDYLNDTRQLPLVAPSVFNFYLPDHQPVGDFVDQDLVGPEFQIHNSQSSIGYLNQAHKWTSWRALFWDWFESTPAAVTDLSPYYTMAEDPETLINYFNVLLVHGRLSEETRANIKNAMDQLPSTRDDYRELRTEICLYLIMISPDYVVIK